MTALVKDLISLFFFITICIFRRNKRAILVYHSIENISPEDDPVKINVRPSIFEKHMRYISDCKDGFLVSFDDGYGSIYTNALPIIKKYGIRSAVFLTTDYIDGKISFDKFFNNRYSPEPLTWDQVKEIGNAGIEIGCHSLSHRKISEVDSDTAYLEISASKKRIEDAVGNSVASFSYPFGNKGSFNSTTKEILKSAGFKNAYTNIMGMDNSGTNPLEINRIRIYDTDNMFRFKMKILGAYNWVDLLAGLFSKNRISCPCQQVPCQKTGERTYIK